jgi:tetratricopeptide (TPR) repeat protein
MARDALGYYAGTLAFTSPDFAEWVEQADRYAESGTVGRVRADTMLGTMNFTTGNLSSGATFLNRALDLASHLGDSGTFWNSAFYWLLFMGAPQHVDKRLLLAEELTKASRTGLSLRDLVAALPLIADVFLMWGQRERAIQICDEARVLAQHTSQIFSQLVSMLMDTIFTTLDGCLEDAVKMSQQIAGHGDELGIPEFARILTGVAALRPYLHLGNVSDALQLTDAPEFLTIPARPLPLAHLGRNCEVNQMLDLLVMGRSGIGTTEDETPAWVDILLLESAVLVGHLPVTDLLLRRLGSKSIPTSGMFYTTCIARHLGAAATLIGRPEEARKYYDEAIRVCTKIRFRPELALTRIQLAELLLEHYPDEKSDALEHLDFAINEFREMKMQPSLERALRHKEILGA